jgi:hypothetical protein
MDRARLRLTALALLLAGCATTPPETPEQAAERRAVSCTEGGFAKDSDAYKVCLMLEQQNDRLDAMEERLRLIESQTVYGPAFPYPRRWYW